MAIKRGVPEQLQKLLAALLALVLTCGIVVAITGVAAPTSQEDALFSEGLITSKEELTFPLGMEAPFNGRGYLAPRIANGEVYNFPQTNNVTFEPGA